MYVICMYVYTYLYICIYTHTYLIVFTCTFYMQTPICRHTHQHTSTHINTRQHTSTHVDTHQHTSTYINAGAMHVLVELLIVSPSHDLVECCVCAIRNLCINSPEHQDELCRCNGMVPLLQLLHLNTKPQVSLRTMTLHLAYLQFFAYSYISTYMPLVFCVCVYILLIHVLYIYVCTCMYLSMYIHAIVALVHQTAGMPGVRGVCLMCLICK